MRHTVHTTEKEETDITNNFGTLYHPKSALVFYETEGYNPDGYVEYFDIDRNGNPINAHPLTVREAQRLSKTLNIQNKKDKDFLRPSGIISENILFTDASDNGKVIWFTKSQERPLLFTEQLSIPNGLANVPPLVWCANKQGMKIFALENNQRPNAETPLFHAPFFNVYESGSVCMGTVDVNIKNSVSLEEFTEKWEDYFFNSYFSHLVNSHNPINGNCVNLWKNLIQSKEAFPTEVLINSNLTLKNLL
ncbi:PRTRC system protein B [Chryseobacterium carnipullorum]|uniref:PRTRC system protein B n=1 Tax=Chryseobacterium carnipullorum TaxID=1124835 RepID=A0A3G6M178_CHRCU|nr:PRTRC system protein B [Chryseobacterium carnipullorum]AZA47043.1 PRTRC system protein B [Chryseobacterium carnipullorum]AZA66391.1 PRTRC system protein B [Chryseobacterium carnipullorum]